MTIVSLTVPIGGVADPQEVTATTRVVPDPRHSYVLALTPAVLSEDTVVVEIDPQTRFIRSVDATASDKTAAILSEVAKTAGRLQGVPVPEFAAPTGTTSFEFDPSDPDQVAAVRTAVQRLGVDIECLGGCERTAPVPSEPQNAILVRPPRTIFIGVCETSCKTNPYTKLINLLSFNGSQLISVPVARSAFVERKTKLTFENGVVTKVDHSKPSEALGLVSIPGMVIGSFFAGIGQAAQDEKAQLDAAKTVLEAQKNLFDAQKGLTEARASFEEAQRKAAKAAPGATGDEAPEGAED